MHFLRPLFAFCLAACFLVIITPAKAQTDSSGTEYSQEPSGKSDFSFQEKYEYFTRAHVEEKTMFKIGFAPTAGWGGYYNFITSFINVIALEHKVTAPVSVLVEVRNHFSGEGNRFGYGVGGSAGVRYYYSINRRMREGKSANNFSNNYLSTQASGIIRGTGEYKSHIGGALLWGAQRRLGRVGYIDFNAGPMGRYSTFGGFAYGAVVNLSVGFAW